MRGDERRVFCEVAFYEMSMLQRTLRAEQGWGLACHNPRPSLGTC